jgi:hypothetical protein
MHAILGVRPGAAPERGGRARRGLGGRAARRYARAVPSPRSGSLRGRAAAALAPVALILALAVVVAPAAGAASLEPGNAFSELAKESPPETKTTATTSSTTTETTNSRSLIFIALGAAALVLATIAIVIARDARRVAPAGDTEAVEQGYARDSAARLRKRRARAKAARQQRKRNR